MRPEDEQALYTAIILFLIKITLYQAYMNPTPPLTPTEEDEVLFDNLTILLTELLLFNKRNIQVETDPWASWENTQPATDPDYPTFTSWIGDIIQPLQGTQWDQPMGHPFNDQHPDFELPDAPMEQDPIPSYESRDSRIVNGPVPGYGDWPNEETDSDSSNEPGPSQRQGGLQNTQTQSNPIPDGLESFTNPHLCQPDDDPFNPRGSDYEWPKLQGVDQEILGPHRSAAWEL
ncbi:hypothetical protein ARMGADRAFT_1076727 [Armillaria gallica]|uniref:Uncharacterized protein n=1 Tax=Armillaria gallica TaxID=47427 RepID=A0A2H3E5D9_ARMGA|nr:hypothetical protein ARMGADRAFT_1076727 [Armillaria gallica]